MPVGEYLNRPGYNIHEDDVGDDDYYKDDDADDCDEDVLGSRLLQNIHLSQDRISFSRLNMKDTFCILTSANRVNDINVSICLAFPQK